MKRIKYESKFLAASGQPFIIANPDVNIQKAARDAAVKAEKTRFGVPTIECNFADAMCWFVNNIPHELDDKGQPVRKLTAEDMGNAYTVIKAFRNVQDGYVALEDSVYKWLVELNKTDGVAAFSVTQAVVTERLEDILKEEAKK